MVSVVISPELLQLLATIATSAGAAFVGGKNSLNGARKEIAATREDVTAIKGDVAAVKVDVAALRAKDGWHDERLRNLEVDRVARPLDETAA